MKQQYLVINSSIDRRSTDLDTSSWTTYLSEPIIPSNSVSKITMTVESIEVPNLAYTFPWHSSVIYYHGTNAVIKTITLDTRQVYISGEDVCVSLNSTQTDLVFSYNKNTTRLSVRNNTNGNIRIVGSYRYDDRLDIAFNNGIDRIGFTQRMTSYITPASIVVADSTIRMLRTNCYYLTCDILKATQMRSPEKDFKPQILCKVSAGNYGYLSQYSYLGTQTLAVQEQNIHKMTFSLLDDEFQPIDVGDQPITMLILIRLS